MTADLAQACADLAAWYHRHFGAHRRCDIHDIATPAKIARIEVETSIDPEAENRMWQRVLELHPGDLVESFFDPDLLDCGRHWCRKRRGLA